MMGKPTRKQQNKKPTTRTIEVICTRVVVGLYTYSFFMLLAMLAIGCITYSTITDINDIKISDINSIVEIDSKKELNDVLDQQGTFDVFIIGKVSTYGTVNSDELGKNLIYVRETTYDNKSGDPVGDEVVEKSDFVKIHSMSINTNTLMLLEPSVTSTKIENGLRTEYSAISKGTEVIIQGTIENGSLKDGAKLYTTTTLEEIKESMDTSSSPIQFVIIWTLLTLLLIYLPIIITIKKRSVRQIIKSNRMPTTREYTEKKSILETRNCDDEFPTQDISEISEKLKSNNPIYKTPRQPKPKGGNNNYNNTRKPTTKNYNRKQPVKQQRRETKNEFKESN